VRDNFTKNLVSVGNEGFDIGYISSALVSVGNEGFDIGYISSANTHKITSLKMFHILILEDRDCTSPTAMKSQS